MIDTAVIGGGPAGLSAAINLYARNKKVIIFGNKIGSSALAKAKKINNHLGMPDTSGEEMLNKFLSHVETLGIEIRNGRVLQVLAQNNSFMINFENEFVQAKSIIIATGISKTKNISGQEKFLGNGVSYCATCDGMFFKNKSVTVISDSSETEDDVIFLSQICKNVRLIPKYNPQTKFNDNVTIMSSDLKVKEICGTSSVDSIIVGKNSSYEDEKIKCDGVFILNEAISPDKIIFGLELDGSFIKIDNMCQTNLKGVFAAGDCTGWPFQVSKAIGQGQIAAQMADKYVSALDKKSLGTR